MKWLPASLGARLLLAFTAAAAAIAVLAVTARDRSGVRAEARAARRLAAEPPPPPAPVLTIALRPCGGQVLLASRLAAVPPDTVPVVQVFADGGAALLRAAPLPQAPASAPPAGDAAIVLPDRSLAELSAPARAALLQLLGQLITERPVPAERVRATDIAVTTADLEPLLQWIP